MTIELNEHQREILAELLDSAHKDKVHELHRTDSLGYKQLLRTRFPRSTALHHDLRGRTRLNEA